MAICEWLCRRDRDPAPGATFRFLPVTLYRLDALSRQHADHQGTGTRPITTHRVLHPWLSQQGSAKLAPLLKAWKYGFSRAVFRMGYASCTSWLIPGMRMRGCPSANCLSCEQSVWLNAYCLSNTFSGTKPSSSTLVRQLARTSSPSLHCTLPLSTALHFDSRTN